MHRARHAGLLALALLLPACGGGAATPAAVAPTASPGSTASATTAAGDPNLTPVSGATSPQPSAAAVAPTIAPAPQPPPPPMPMAATRSFALVAEGDRGARGSVTVTVQSGRATIEVAVGGLPPGSVHSVHLHFGNCPSAGSHILVLGALRADGAGNGTVTGVVNAAFTGAGHFVIVYVGPSAGPLGACANIA